MERWYLLLRVHDHVLKDKRWPVSVRLDTCKLLMKKMLELGDLKPLPVEKEAELISKAKA